MREPPSLSVLMPVRDGGDCLDEAMASVIGQSFTDFEVIVVDDGSTDGTAELLREWSGRDERIRVVSGGRVGIVRALEIARQEARGRFLARMDADDIADPRRFTLQYEFMMANPGSAGCGCGVRYFPEGSVRDGARRYEAWINRIRSPEDVRRAIWIECPLAHPTWFLRAQVVAEVGGYQDLGWPEDYDLMLRIHSAGHALANLPQVLHAWREGPTRLSRTHIRYSTAAFLRCRVHYLREGPLANDRAAVVWGAGPVGKTFATALQAAGTRIAAFVDLDPRKIGQEIHGAPVIDAVQAVEIRGPLHAAAVGQPGARGQIEALLEQGGFVPGEDFVAVA